MPVHLETLRSRRTPLAVVAVAALALLGACSGHPGAPAPAPTPAGSSVTTPAGPSPTPTPTAPVEQPPAAHDQPQGTPRRVVVRALGDAKLVDAKLVPTGLDDNGILAPPPGVAGWYDEKGWPAPGYPGTAILAGHINTRAHGPDTFARLPQVRPGATVRVTYSSGDVVEFVVTKSAAVPKKVTPKDDTIWDAGNPRPLLRLITCDPTTPLEGGHYVGNWVVWAVLRR